MKAYRMPLYGGKKRVIVAPSRGQYCYQERIHDNLSMKIEETDLPLIEGEEEAIRKRNNFFMQKRKEFTRNNSDVVRKLFYLITPECKGRCTYCYAHHSRDEATVGDKFLSYDNFILACEKYGIDLTRVLDIQLLGGEPLLYIDEVIKLATNHPDIIIGVSTGLMVDMSVIEKLMSTLCLMPNVSLSISIDPYYPEYARIYEGKQFYHEALVRLGMIDKVTAQWGIRATISNSQQDIKQLEQDVRNATNDHESFLAFTVDLLMGEAQENQTATLDNLFEWAKTQVDRAIFCEREAIYDIEVFENSLPYPVKHFFSLFRNFGFSVVQQSSCCDVLTQRMAIDYTGSLNYCAESPMTEQAEDWRFNGLTEEIVERRHYSAPECEVCEIYQYCGGVCFFNFHYYGLNKYQCKWWEYCGILAVYAMLNYKEKKAIHLKRRIT